MTRTALALMLAATAGLAVPSHAEPVTVEQLQDALKQRDATIAALEQRIASLEAARPAAQWPAGGQAPSFPSSQADDVKLQALTRGLVQKGLLLLPEGAIEVTPSLAYTHSQKQGLVLVDTPDGISVVSDQRQRSDGIDAAVSVRYGLPWSSQVQIRIPYSWRRDESAIGDNTRVRNSDTHIGDIELELAHQFLTEGPGRPGVTATIAWRLPTGRDVFSAPAAGVATGAGSHQLSARVTALKSLDPVVVFGTLSYGYNFRRKEGFGRFKPGNIIDLSLGGLLAVSPETSLSFAFTQQFRNRTRIDKLKINGSDGVASVASFGLDQLLSSRMLLTGTLGIGLTNDAPDYQFLLSAPMRF